MTFADHLFKRRHFDRLIITLCIRWHVRYKLSYRDLVEMMAQYGALGGEMRFSLILETRSRERSENFNAIALIV